MSNLLKVAIFTAPLAAIVFYYVVLQQSKMDTELKKESLKFEQQWNEFKAESPFTLDKKKYEERAKVTEQKQQKLEEKEKEKEQRLERFESEFEKALNETNQKIKKEVRNERS